MQMDALIHFHFKVDPETLSDDKYFELQAKLEWIIEKQGGNIY